MKTTSIALRAKRKGFTIVELLIVVVIIAILAAITIVAYNGVQQRAKNAQDAEAVTQFVKSLYASALQNGKYPVVPSYSCISSNPSQICADTTSTTSACNGFGQATGSTALISNLQAANVGIPTFSMQPVQCGGQTYAGAFMNMTSDGSSAAFYYFAPSSQPCPNGTPGTVTSSISGGMNICTYSLPAPNSL